MNEWSVRADTDTDTETDTQIQQHMWLVRVPLVSQSASVPCTDRHVLEGADVCICSGEAQLLADAKVANLHLPQPSMQRVFETIFFERGGCVSTLLLPRGKARVLPVRGNSSECWTASRPGVQRRVGCVESTAQAAPGVQ